MGDTAPLSPYLFSIYVEPSGQPITKSGFGCTIGNLSANIFMYADDVILLSPTLKGMRQLVCLSEIYEAECELNFNV